MVIFNKNLKQSGTWVDIICLISHFVISRSIVTKLISKIWSYRKSKSRVFNRQYPGANLGGKGHRSQGPRTSTKHKQVSALGSSTEAAGCPQQGVTYRLSGRCRNDDGLSFTSNEDVNTSSALCHVAAAYISLSVRSADCPPHRQTHAQHKPEYEHAVQ